MINIIYFFIKKNHNIYKFIYNHYNKKNRYINIYIKLMEN